MPLVGAVAPFLGERALRAALPHLVALAAGALLGAALFHLLPEGAHHLPGVRAYAWAGVGFVAMLVLEQTLHAEQRRRLNDPQAKPLGRVVAIADSLHHVVGGLAVAAALTIDLRLGVVTWFAAAAHELPQELGDVGLLLAGSWSVRRAIARNVGASLAFLGGGLAAYAARGHVDTAFLLPLAAGAFLFLAATALLPDVRGEPVEEVDRWPLATFLAGLAVLFAIAA